MTRDRRSPYGPGTFFTSASSVAMTSPNNRNHSRHSINKEFASVDDFIAEYVTNISRSGVFIRSKTPLPVGTRVNLKFSVILEDFETIEGEGEVVRVVDDGEEQGMGVVFTTLTERSREIIEALVKTEE